MVQAVNADWYGKWTINRTEYVEEHFKVLINA